jgi:hypothetical protein
LQRSSVNRIAGELKKTHPDKYISTLAYENYYWHPKIALQSNVAVAPCLATRCHWNLTYRTNEITHYQEWIRDGRPTFLWNYYCFPEEPAVTKKWHCWPGFMIHYDDPTADVESRPRRYRRWDCVAVRTDPDRV